MVLRYRVSLEGIKGFARVYEVDASTTLYEFHKLLQDELDLPHDQQIQFKALDAHGSLAARFGFFDLGSGAVDEVNFAKTVQMEIASFVYFYDITNKKKLIITLEEEVDSKKRLEKPLLTESKGPNPIDFENGYVAYEDLPDEQKHIRDNSVRPAKPVAEDDSDLDEPLGDDEDLDDVDDEEEEDDDEDGKIIYDGTEELGF